MRPLKRASARLPTAPTPPRPAAACHRSLATHPARPPSNPTTATPLTSLLIANRGEIALRIARTATAMGIPTTTVFTPPDARAPHAAAGTAGSLALASYLDGDRLVALARAHGIHAVHPGYGFLSEDPAFARRVTEAGLVFVGPPPDAMAAMGDKAHSKEVMTAAGVPCVPGYHGPEQEVDQLARHAEEIGFPVLLKSVRGGGGKGMRIVRRAGEFAAQLQSARVEARAAFGDGGEVMLVEKYIERPRHVEVQVFADRHGNCVALGERDCSVQRRHQKILEESPAPDLVAATRHDLWHKARTAALAVGYVGAGTVEFILDRNSGKFYFMEMNTRLQVEHPVTEMVTGTDLVEWQFRIAAGEPLPLTQAAIETRISERGAAIEARIYAESPASGFLPDSGTLLHLIYPQTSADVRIDAGVVEGNTVSEAYDGMIAKLIVRGSDRAMAIHKMDLALRDFEVAGLRTNVDFLKRLCRNRAFVDADLDTAFIERQRDELFRPHPVEPEVLVQAALGLLRSHTTVSSPLPPHGEPLGFSPAGVLGERKFVFRVVESGGALAAPEDDTVEVTVTQQEPNLYDATVSRLHAKGAEPITCEGLVCGSAATRGLKTHLTTYFPDTRVSTTLVQDPSNDHKLSIFQNGTKTDLTLLPPAWMEKALGANGDAAATSVVAPMPCKVLRNAVTVGQEVKRGDALVVIESMKMETVIRSPHDGVIKRLAHREGDICKAGTVLVIFAGEGDTGEGDAQPVG